ADCIVSNSTIHKFATDLGAVILNRCSGFSLSGLNLSDCGSGFVLNNTTDTTISNCRVTRTTTGSPDIAIDGSNKNILLSGNAFGGETTIAPQATIANELP